MDYQQTIDYLYNTLPMFSRMGSAAYKKDIHNTIAICEWLNNPQTKFKSIHIAGTNGKGSVSHMLAALFQTAGYKTGLYTSPHLYDFRERIRINGEMADRDFVVEFVERVKPLIEEIQPSFFEITVAMAFEYFAKNKIDIAIIETGLGGRLDSTNIISPELSIITNIGWDHMNLLGKSLKEIAFEKAGIIKENIPVVIGEKHEETEKVFIEEARQKNAEIYFAQDRFAIEDYDLSPEKIHIAVHDQQIDKIQAYDLDLPGIYQTKNIITVVQAIELLSDYNFNQETINQAFSNSKKLTGLQGRWEVIHQNPLVVLEAAHNKEGIEQMFRHIEKLSFNKLHLVTGVVKDKDLNTVLDLFPKDANYYFTQANIPRALDAEILKSKASEYSLKGEVYKDVNLALQKAIENASEDDLIIVSGSIFLIAEVTRENYTN